MALNTHGSVAFEQSEPARWQPDGWGMDRLSVQYKGYVDNLETFLAAHPLWEASALNSHMFLEGYSNDDHKQFPTATLQYIGKRNGAVPPARNNQGTAQQTAQFTSFTGRTTISLTYVSKTTTRSVWSREPIDPTSIGAIAPATDVAVVWFVARSEGFEYTVGLETVLDFFVSKLITVGTSEEIVPGEYYNGIETKMWQLFSLQA